MLRHNQHTFYINLYSGAFCFIKKKQNPGLLPGLYILNPFRVDILNKFISELTRFTIGMLKPETSNQQPVTSTD